MKEPLLTTDEKILIVKVAQCAGWKQCGDTLEGFGGYLPGSGDGDCRVTDSDKWRRLPLYTRSLDAMRSVEEVHILNSIARMTRYQELVNGLSMMRDGNPGTFATARCRAEAFVRVMREIP